MRVFQKVFSERPTEKKISMKKKVVVKMMCEMPINRLTDFQLWQTDKWLGRARAMCSAKLPFDFNALVFPLLNQEKHTLAYNQPENVHIMSCITRKGLPFRSPVAWKTDTRLLSPGFGLIFPCLK